MINILTALVTGLAGYALYLYFRPPEITPVSEETLVQLARLDALKGDE